MGQGHQSIGMAELMEKDSIWQYVTTNDWAGHSIQLVHEHLVVVDFVEYVVIRDWDTPSQKAVGRPYLFKYQELTKYWEHVKDIND